MAFLEFRVEVRKSKTGNLCCCIPEARCAATSCSIEELTEIITEMIEDYIEDCREENLPVPMPQQRCVVADSDGGFVQMISVKVRTMTE